MKKSESEIKSNSIRPNNGKKYDILMNELGLDETYTKPVYKMPKFDKVKELVHPKEDFNYQADLLMLPITKKKFRYLLLIVIVDLWSDEIDAEPLRTKETPEVLTAMKKIFTRPYLNKPKASLRTDAGTEFKGQVNKFLHDNSILHSVTMPGRHKQTGSVENVNKLLGRYLINYMTKKEKETGKEYNEWTEILNELIRKLNKIRKRPDGDPFAIRAAPKFDIIENQQYKVGDLVYRKLDIPKNALNNFEKDNPKFRTDYRWDTEEPKKIKYVLYYPRNIRYVLNGYPNVAYTQDELKFAKQKESEELFAVKKIWEKKIERKTIFYKVWWKKYLKKDSTWEPKSNLIIDGFQNEIDEFEQTLKKK